MYRYAHRELTAAAEVACAAAMSAPLVFGVRGIADFVEAWQGLVFFAALSTVYGALTCTRVPWLGGEKQDFESALPLANPDAVLPTRRESLRRSFDWRFLVFLVMVGLVIGLVWEPLVALCPLLLLPERLAKGAYVAHWERRHKVTLWWGNVPDQPLAKGQRLYSSAQHPVS